MIRMDPVAQISGDKLKDIVNDFTRSDRVRQFQENNEYFKGQDKFILNRKTQSTGPDNKIPVSYGRRIINLVTGYMYKPGLVQYTSEDEAYIEKLNEIFDANREPIKTEQVGKQTSIQGVGYEYHWVEGKYNGKGDVEGIDPRFAKLPADEVIPLYDHEIEPGLWAFVRVVRRSGKQLAWVYYSKYWETFSRADENEAFTTTGIGEHFYGQVPLVVYRNNEEEIGDFEPVMHLIDAYDVLMSDSMNEFDRFAWAYLLLKGMRMSDQDASNVKHRRMFEDLESTDAVKFLTKDMATDFIKFMTDLVRDEIHRQSGIPNLEDYDASGASGKTMGKFIYLMELFTDPKESYFKEGLYKRVELIDAIRRFGEKPGRVDIIMNRNMPDASKEQAEIFTMYSGRVSQKTLLENFADFVKDADAEMKQLEEEGAAYAIDVEDIGDDNAGTT